MENQGRTNPALSKPCLCLSDTRHIRHFRRFRASEERSLCSQWVECKFVIFDVFVETEPFCRGTKSRFTKNTVCATPRKGGGYIRENSCAHFPWTFRLVADVCLEEECLKLPGQVWDMRFLQSSPLFSSPGIQLEVPDMILPDVGDQPTVEGRNYYIKLAKYFAAFAARVLRHVT